MAPQPQLVFFDFSFWQNSFSNGLATLLGVIIGIPIALLLNNFIEKKTESSKRLKILKSLKDELEYSELELSRNLDKEVLKLECGVLSSTLRNELWKAFSDGGELQWINDVNLLAQLADTYYSIRACMDLADCYYQSVQFATEEASPRRIGEVFSTLVNAVEYSHRAVSKTIGDIKTIIGNK